MSQSGMRMTSSDGALWRFDPGTLFIEFMLTGGPDQFARYDSLHQPADLEQWAAACRLSLDPEAVSATSADILAARDLRNALWRLTRQVISGSQRDPADVATINQAAGSAPLVPQITAAGHGSWRSPITASAVLSTVARDAIEVLTGPAAGRLRECAADDCQLVFLDTSRPGARRWCSMERCGNRHKVRAIRSRRSTSAANTALINEKGPQ
ncbi:MAG: ABATE domain-containing protein [Nakamurella sp.]